MTPLTSERLPRTIARSAELVQEGAFQYECRGPKSSGASNDKNGAESGAVSTYNCHTQVASDKPYGRLPIFLS